jgi:hypothetical protein
MGNIIFSFGCDLTYDPKQGIEVHIKQCDNYSHETIRHLIRAGEEIILGFQNLANPAPEASGKTREIIEIEEG